MKRGLPFAFLLSVLFSVGGCSLFEFLDANRTLSQDAVKTTQDEPATEPEYMSRPDSPDPYLSRAQQAESEDEFQRALRYLEVAAAIDPNNTDISVQVERMQTIIDSKSESHFQRGLDYHQRGKIEKAKKEWLTALRINPGHKRALAFLKEKLTLSSVIDYKLKSGDTPEKISKKVYHSSQQGWVVAYFYDFKSGNRPVPGDVIHLPVLDPELTKPMQKPPKPAMDIKSEIAKAEKLLAEKRYEEVLQVAEKILDDDYLNQEAGGLINAVYYDKGRGYYQQENYPDALIELKRVDPNYMDTAARVSEIESILHQQAETYYLEGVKHYINEDLERAIQSWEITLKLNPDHKKAKTDIEGARNLLEKLGTVE